MNTLIIDCSAGMSVYVLKNEDVFEKIDCAEKKHTDELLNVVDDLLKQANLKISDINNICVCVGPGSFTGIRVAISICKGLAIGASAKVFVASNFDIMEKSKSDKAVYVLDGFSKFLYIRKVENGNISEECIAIDDLVNLIKNDKFEVVVQNEKVQNILKKYEIQSNIAQNQTILHFLEKINKNEYSDINTISPVYLRASQAEMERNARLSGDKNV